MTSIPTASTPTRSGVQAARGPSARLAKLLFPRARRRSSSQKVFVASFFPANESFSVGGFDWSFDQQEAESMYVQHVRDSRIDGGHIVRLVETFTDCVDCDDVTDDLDGRLYELEFEGAALRQYVPHTAEPDWCPIGQVRRVDP